MDQWTKTIRDGYNAWIGETEFISFCVIPSLGSKGVSLLDRRTNREWLWQSGKPLGNQGYGSSFGEGDESGWDEMFPGINACQYPTGPWEGTVIPDHGEVWSLSWSDKITSEGLRCTVDGVEFPYTLEKQYSFTYPEILRIDYKLRNRSDASFPFLWAAHPLFNVREGMRLHVPQDLDQIMISYSEHQRLGVFEDRQAWPQVETSNGTIDLSFIESKQSNFAEKYYFVGKLTEGFAALSDPETGEMLTIKFPPDKVPYLAIWANYGGYGGYHHFAIEPATGILDDLSYAIRADKVMSVDAYGTYEWFLELQFG